MKRFFRPVLGLSLLLAALCWAARSPAEDREAMAEAAPSSSPVLREDDFCLAERDGVVAVFSPAGSEQPREITDIRVALLPAADRERLQAGILAGDRRELAMLLEDLGS